MYGVLYGSPYIAIGLYWTNWESVSTVTHPTLPPEIATDLQRALSECSAVRGLSDYARDTIRTVCSMARSSLWTPEQLVVAVKEVCYSSPDFARQHTTSEREAIIARIVTGCIREFYRTQVS